MDGEALQLHIQHLEESNHQLAINFKETTSALLDRVRALEEELKATSVPAAPQLSVCPECKAQVEDLQGHVAVCGKGAAPVKGRQGHPLQEQVRATLQGDELGKFRKLIGQGFPLDYSFQDTGMCED